VERSPRGVSEQLAKQCRLSHPATAVQHEQAAARPLEMVLQQLEFALATDEIYDVSRLA
jgi:hypothetical protein